MARSLRGRTHEALTRIKATSHGSGILAVMTSSTSYTALTRDISRQLTVLRSDLPAGMKAFSDLSKAVLSDGALTEKTKELIALALGVAARCDGCLGFHAKALARLGATRAEVEEALAVAVYMGGGPSLMYSANAMTAFAEFAPQTSEIRP
jgi:AhpD family alkylhydroperoxidase